MPKNEEVKKIFSSIFIPGNKQNDNLPFLISSNAISKLIIYLLDPNKTMEEKLDILTTLLGYFQFNENLINVFMRPIFYKFKFYTLIESLIDIYISPTLKSEQISLIEKIIKLILSHISISKSSIEYIYQKLSLYFYNKNKQILDENLLFKYLNLLNLLYSENTCENELKIQKEIKNYMYFNGKNSALTFKLNENPTNINTNFPTLENGLTLFFCCYIKKNLMTQFYELDEKNKFQLVEIIIGEHQICLVLDDINNIKIVSDKKDTSIINIKSCLKFDDWNNICLIINPKSTFTLDINIIINGKNNNSFLPTAKNFQISEKIKEINLFKNFLGLATSVLFFSFELNQKQIQYFNDLKYGFNKKRILFEFFMKNNKDFLSNGMNKNKYSDKIKVDKYLNLFDFSLAKQNIKNLVCFLLPFNYNKEKNEIHDIFGNFYGKLGENDGVNNYKNYSKNIRVLGGINNLLPIFELFYSTNPKAKNIQYKYINKNILTEKTFLAFFKILDNLFTNNKNNLIEANNCRFFSNLEIFLEKFPPKVFNNDEVIKIFINIGKIYFELENSGVKDLKNDNFINMVLINEKILYKFNKKNQIIIWDNLYQLFLKNGKNLENLLNIPKICLIIRYYDENRYKEYCCTKHANLFKPNKLKEKEEYKPIIMKPEMNKKIDIFFKIIELYVDKLDYREEIIDIFKMLLMDLSPCLQKKIISLFYNFFANDKIQIFERKTLLDTLLKNNMLEIMEYVLDISFLDVRIEILKLFKLILDNQGLAEACSKYINIMKGENGIKYVHNFFADNSIPDKIIINNGGEKKQLINYFNKEIYGKDLDTLWIYLTKWLKYITNDNLTFSELLKFENQNNNSIIFLSEEMIDYCLLFVSKSSGKYIEHFLAIIFSFLEDKTISNRILLYENAHIYQWIIQTIFYFYNEENEKNMNEKQYIANIKNQSINFFSEFFSHRRPNEEFLKRVKYILEYSYKLKELLNKEEKSIDENTKIIRILFEKLIEKVPKKLNDVINIYFGFIIFYKNSSKYENKLRNIKEDLNKFSNDFINLKPNDENKSTLYKYSLMPKYIYEGLNINKLTEKEKKSTLKEIWQDSNLYDLIIDYYKTNLWGVEYLCKKIKVEYNGDPLKISRQLLKEYADNKAYKNILTEDIIKYYNIKISEQKNESNKIIEDNKIDIFNINLILLCIAIELTLDEGESNFILGLFQQFIIYLIIASTNISPQDKFHDYIQDKIYDSLGYGILFLSKIDKKRFLEICDEVLLPIIELIYSDSSKKKIKTIFQGKKNMFNNTAINKLFVGKEMIDNDGKKKANKDKENKENENKLQIMFKGDISKIINNIFNIDISYLKDKEIEIEIFYKNIYTNEKGIYDKENEEEKNKVIKKVLKLLPFYDTLVKKYSNDSALKEKIRRNTYKRIKKRLFTWRGFWSDRELFFVHPEKLKLKRKNHVSKEMVMPLLCPVLDMDYYLPDFSKFDKKNLFNKKNHDYKINLNIDDILRDGLEETIEKEKNKTSNDKKEIKNEFMKNNYNFNYLECIYSSNSDKIWEKYISYYDEKFNFRKIILQNKKAFDMFISSKIISTNENERKIQNIYNCCIVKQTHHVKGYISTERSQLRFYFDSESRKYDTEELLENDPTYDRDMDCCFGSIFKTNKADKDKINFFIEYINIKYMFLRYYFYIQSGLEIYTNNNKVYFLNFKTNKDLLSFTNDIISHSNENFAFREIKAEDYKGKKLLGYELYKPNIKNKDIDKEYLINNKMIEWKSRNISSLEYLMWLNIYAGRSFNDLTQYPVFPWLITNYEKNELDMQKDLRDLGLCMGMLSISEKGEARKETFCDTYEMVKNDLMEMFPDFNYNDYLKKQDDYYESYRNKEKKKKDKDKNQDENKLDVNHLPYYYGSHYSNPTYVSHYLSRAFPSAFVSIEIQGEKFDDPDRLFFSMNKTFISASSLKDDVRELIPEFYLMPEIFLNLNNLNLSQDKISFDNKKYEINDVELPPWCKNTSWKFVAKLRRILENNNLKTLNKWIDLIFGSAQRGEKAEENKNIFKAQSYERMVKINDITDPDSRNALMRLIETGVTPLQIFSSDSKTKMDKKQFLEKSPIYSNSKGNFIFDKKDFKFKIIKLNNFNNIKKKLYVNDKYSKNKIYCLGKDDFPNIKIVKMYPIENNSIRIFTNTNQWFNLKVYPNSKDLSPEESSLYEIENNSSKYSNNFIMNNTNFPMIFYDNCKYLLRGGFMDGRFELNSLNSDQKEEIISITIFNDFGCINIMEINEKENLLLCGTNNGNLLYFNITNKIFELKSNRYIHTESIISISINDNLNMFATSSKDGYIFLYTIPSYKLIRSIYIPYLLNDETEFFYADNIFLSNYPIPCITIYISKKRIFKIFTINGSWIGDIEENKNIESIKCGTILTSYDYQDYLIYGTNNGFIKIRKLPELDLIQEINPLNKSIECLCVSKDSRLIFCWSDSNEIVVISNNFVK